jgi:integral membrane sensor domain MASE1
MAVKGDSLTDGRPSSTRFSILSIVCPVLVAVAYYLGAQVGFAMQSPNAPQSVLWLPNSILLATLLITPYRQWPLYLIVAFPAHMLVASGAGAPLPTLALLFLTNCADATLGAWLVRRLSGSPAAFRFDGLRSIVIFAVTVAGSTLLLSFADAGISVATGWSESFAAAFFTRVRSNILTHLIVVPAIVDLASLQLRRVRAARYVEAVALTAVLVLICAFAFSRPTTSKSFPALLYAPLPVLLWATVRFGPGGTGWSALLVAMAASWNTDGDPSRRTRRSRKSRRFSCFCWPVRFRCCSWPR